jgi:hypothetical protein|tara:strand:- start:5772 stop:6179 length:408 start_codon:yes stop_codon:yes gene_type:complete
VSEATEATPGICGISVTSKKTGRTLTFERNFGATLDEATEMFGADVVLSVFHAQAVIRAQGVARSILDNEENSDDKALDAGLNYTPGVVRKGGGRAKKDPMRALAEHAVKAGISHEVLVQQMQEALAALEAEEQE